MASISVPCPKISSSPALRSSTTKLAAAQKFSFWDPNPEHNSSSSRSEIPKSAFSGFQLASRQQNGICRLHSKLNQVVTAEKTSSSATITETNSRATSPNEEVESTEKIIPDASEISAFIAQVSDLVKLVDSRDIVELELKQFDCEVTIRKKEALQLVASATPIVTMPQVMPHAAFPTQPPAQTTVPAATPASQASPALAPSAPASVKMGRSSHLPFKCPMAGTLYRCPAPGEPPFVKLGDKVQKGQVICIIEAMKLMNEIEADQSGTITEILVEDGKPVSVDTPLFLIVP